MIDQKYFVAEEREMLCHGKIRSACVITIMVFEIAQSPNKSEDKSQTFVTFSTFNDSTTVLVLIELIVLFIQSSS